MGTLPSFSEKLRIATHLQKATGVDSKLAQPAHYRLLWKCGLHVPPPLLAPAWITFAVHCGPTALGVLGMLGVVGALTEEGQVRWFLIGIALFLSWLLAGVVTFSMWYQRRKRELPTWVELDDLLKAGKLQKLLRDNLA